MNQAYAQDTYVNNQVMAASKKKLLIMLYDGAIKNLKLAEMAIDSKSIEKTNNFIGKTQEIIVELMSTLNFDINKEIANGLYGLYDYMYNQLVEANIKKEKQNIQEVKNFMQELRDTWAQI